MRETEFLICSRMSTELPECIVLGLGFRVQSVESMVLCVGLRVEGLVCQREQL